VSATRAATAGQGLEAADLVVLSHLRWDWVWQRPQHLISRLGRDRRTLFVEEPALADVAGPTVRVEQEGSFTRLWLDVPDPSERALEYSGYGGRYYAGAIQALLAGRPRDVWLYTPTALPIAESLEPRLLAYDVMDDLSSFADASPEMELLTRRALALADIAFAGGRSLHRAAAAVRGKLLTHLFPSGVEFEHYSRSRSLRRPHARPVAGYVGVIDERLDLELIASVADQLPDWEICLVGPTAKIDPTSVPTAPNIRQLGQQSYERLPEIMATFDVALMPFALNDATRSISPTKTLEYLAAGLPVVSTPVADVVSDWSSVVHLADDAPAFAAGCREVLTDSLSERDRALAPLSKRYEWDHIATQMRELLQQSLLSARAAAAA
jgi:glycosyltransferase involved in cell wall biosynthesis